MVRTAIIFFDSNGNVYTVCSVLAASEAQADVDTAVRAQWTDADLRITVEDDGPGFAGEILERIGEPYVTTRPGSYALGETELSPEDEFTGQQGMGLGFFIAKTLLERSGAKVTFRNEREGGAVILTQWPRRRIEAPDP